MPALPLACGPDFSVLSGDDNLTLPLMSVGGRGVISVIANFVPRETAEMTHAALAGDWKLARELHLKLFPLARAAFMETNPIPVKAALKMLGRDSGAYRPPMCEPTAITLAALQAEQSGLSRRVEDAVAMASLPDLFSTTSSPNWRAFRRNALICFSFIWASYSSWLRRTYVMPCFNARYTMRASLCAVAVTAP